MVFSQDLWKCQCIERLLSIEYLWFVFSFTHTPSLYHVYALFSTTDLFSILDLKQTEKKNI